MKNRSFSLLVYRYRIPILGFVALLLVAWFFLLSPSSPLLFFSGDKVLLVGSLDDQLTSVSGVGRYSLKPGLGDGECIWIEGGRDENLQPVLTVQYFSGGSCSSFPIRTEVIPRDAGVTMLSSECICGVDSCTLKVSEQGDSFDYSLGGCG